MKKCILFADEEVWWLYDLMELVEYFHPDLKIDHVHNGKWALKRLSESSYVCLVLDIMMPYGDENVTEIYGGLIVLEQVCKIHPNLKVIVYTARMDQIIPDTVSKFKNASLVYKEDSPDKILKQLELFLI